ncbi:MAG: hypothetical protein GC190_15365 [Alphaproteobacteria bacterium]|nr:hypothetical protein [Alphaproteobacteria bacterium]
MSGFVGYVGDPLNSMWRINVSGQVYGPYTGHQIKAFAAEGRIAAHSIVQSGEAGPWITAIDDPILSQLFIVQQPPAAKSIAEPKAAQPTRQSSAQTSNATPDLASSNFIIIADIRGRASAPFEAALNRLGINFQLNSLVWLLHSEYSAGAIRNELVTHLGNTDSVFIADAGRGKMAWFNLGPEVDARIRKVWQKGGDKSA